MLKTYFILNLYFLMLFIEIRETQCAYALEVRLRQYSLQKNHEFQINSILRFTKNVVLFVPNESKCQSIYVSMFPKLCCCAKAGANADTRSLVARKLLSILLYHT